MRTIMRFLTVCCLIVAFSIIYTPAWAANATVTNCTNFTGRGSISAAIAVANADGGTITFLCSGTIIFADDLTITNNVTINANGNRVIFDGNNAVRHFRVSAGTSLTLNGFILRNGNGGWGGAIYNYGGTLTITNSTFSNNSASSFGFGGAIASRDGMTTITNSTFSSNWSGNGGAIARLGGLMTITDSTFSRNISGGDGGAIFNIGNSLTITNSTFSSNWSGNGGAIYSGGILTIINSTLSHNLAGDGGAIYNIGIVNSQDSHYSSNNCVNDTGATINDMGGNTNVSSLGCPGGA